MRTGLNTSVKKSIDPCQPAHHTCTHHNSADLLPTSNLLCINPLTDYKILDQTKLKAFADNKHK